MAPFDRFSHYLAYGATDQETFRELRDSYDGVLVPATIAAWQRQGTGGFVLSLSATPEAPPYMIDPRFPLFQQGLPNAKQSHIALAGLLGDKALIRRADPTPDTFNDERLAELARRWVEFNRRYGSSSNEKFDKYAQRLGHQIGSDQAQGPEAVLAPYFACRDANDPWWARSRRLWEHARAACTEGPCLRVVCARQSGALDELLEDVGGPEHLVVWVSGLDEHNATSPDLLAYRTAIERAKQRDQEPFALYGGFFSVLLGTAGLRGAAHGVGFSEHRNWRELPEAGAPPARYYLRRAHRFVAQDLAQALWEVDPDLAYCPCPHCGGREPVALNYHELMKHSVSCRAEEIGEWYDRDFATAAALLEEDHATMTDGIRNSPLAPRIRRRAILTLEHVTTWVEALRA